MLFRLRRYIKHSRQCFIGYPNTSNFVKNTPLRVVFSTLFSVFGYPDETLSLVFDILHEFTNHLGQLLCSPSIECFLHFFIGDFNAFFVSPIKRPLPYTNPIPLTPCHWSDSGSDFRLRPVERLKYRHVSGIR